MIGRIIGASLGRRIAGRNNGTRGMLLGALAPMIARRAFGPLGLALAGGYVAKKVYDRSRARRSAIQVAPEVAPFPVPLPRA